MLFSESKVKSAIPTRIDDKIFSKETKPQKQCLLGTKCCHLELEYNRSSCLIQTVKSMEKVEQTNEAKASDVDRDSSA